MKKTFIFVLAVLIVLLSFYKKNNLNHVEGEENMTISREVLENNQREIYLAGGCFWGVEGYFKKLDGVYDTETGYANGNSESTSYGELHNTDHAETVKISYDRSRISLEEILLHYFRIIDPKSLNKQGNDVGRQYRTGIYYTDQSLLPSIEKIMKYEESIHGELAVELAELRHFIKAEDYHQDYLDKNPGGYCHIDLGLANKPLFDKNYELPSDEQIKNMLDDEAYNVMKKSATEYPHTSELNDEHRKGIYVDKITGEPLFSSSNKFDAGCGWPSFSKPITSDKLAENTDTSHGMIRTEVRAKNSDSHLGHVFTDGPQDMGGLRYCINGAALKFIPYEDMDKEGYSEYKVFCE